MSKKDMFRKEQRFSFRKFSFGLASALIANVIFGGAIASSPVVHADTAIEPSTVNAGEAGPTQASQRLVSLSYTVNLVDQAGQAISSQTKTLEVTSSQANATATVELAADLVPEGYTLVSGLGQVTVTEHAENVFTVVVEKVAVTPEHTEGVSSNEEEKVQVVPENAKGDSPDTEEKVEGATEEQAAPVDKTNLEQLISEANLLIPEGEKKAKDNAELATAVQAAKPVLASAQAVFDDAAATGDQVLAQETDLRVANKAIGDQLALLSEDGVVRAVLSTTTPQSENPVVPIIGDMPRDANGNLVNAKHNDPKIYRIVHVFGKVTGETTIDEAGTQKGVAPGFDAVPAIEKFPITDPQGGDLRITYVVPSDVVTHNLDTNETTYNANASEEMSGLESKNGRTILNPDGTFTGRFSWDEGNLVSRTVIVRDAEGHMTKSNPFYIVSYTDKLKDSTRLTVSGTAGLTKDAIFGKLLIDTTKNPVSNDAITVAAGNYTRTIVGYRLNGDRTTVQNEDLSGFPRSAQYDVIVKTTNKYGQAIYNWVPVTDTRTKEVAKNNLYVFNNTPILTVDDVTYTENNTNKVKIGTVEDKNGVTAFTFYQSPSNLITPIDGIALTKTDIAGTNNSEAYASGMPSVSKLGVYRRSFGVTDTLGNTDFVFTSGGNADNRHITQVLDTRFTNNTANLEKQVGQLPTKEEILAKVEVITGAPGDRIILADGTMVRSKDLKPGETVPTAPGTYDVVVRVVTQSYVYKDVTVKVIIPKYTDSLTATADQNTSLVPGSGTAVTQPIVINDTSNTQTTAPNGTTYAVDATFLAQKQALDYEISVNTDGVVSVKAPKGQDSDITVPVTVTYPDKTTDSVDVPFKVNQTDSAQLKAKDSIDERLATGTAALTAKKDAEIAEINNHPDLNDEQKRVAIAAVEAALPIQQAALEKAARDAKTAIDAATTPEAVAKAKADGEKAVVGAEDAGEAALDLVTTKATAKDDIDDALAKETAAIDAAKQADLTAIENNPNLTQAQKDAAKAAVNTAAGDAISALTQKANDAKTAIDAAKTPAAVSQAKKDGEDALDLEASKAAATNAINDAQVAKIADLEAKRKADIAAIDAANLTDAEKQAAKDALNATIDATIAAVNGAADTAKQGIATATSPADVATKQGEGLTAINTAATSTPQDAQPLDLLAAKVAAKDAINDKLKADKAALETKRAEAIAVIDAANLTDAEKQAAKDALSATIDATIAAVEKAAGDAKTAIDTATSPDDVATKQEEGLEAINTAATTTPQGAQPLDQLAAKVAATDAINDKLDAEKAAIEAKRDAEIKAITDNPDYTDDAGKQAAIDAINKAADDTLKQLNDAAATAKQDIATQTSPEKLESAKITGLDLLGDKENEGEEAIDLIVAKTEAADAIDDKLAADKAALETKRAEAIAAIEAADLTEAEETAAKKALNDTINTAIGDLEAKATAAKGNIEKAATPVEVEKAKTAGETALDKVVTDLAQPLDLLAAKVAATDAINDKLNAEKAAIEAKRDAEIKAITDNPDYTDAATKKAAIDAIKQATDNTLKQLNDAAATAKQDIAAATTLADVESKKSEGIDNLTTKADEGEAAIDLIVAKTEAKDAIDDKLADELQDLADKLAEAEATIDASTMDEAEKKAAKEAIRTVVANQEKELAKQAETATAAIDAADTPAKVADAKLEGVTDLTDAGQVAEKAIDFATAKELAKEAIRTEAEEAVQAVEKIADDAIKAIESNPNLSQAEKDAEIAKVNAAAETALETIADNAKKAMDAAEKAQALSDLETAKEAQQTADNKALDTATPLIDAAVLTAAKQDAVNKLEKDAKAAEEAIKANPNLTEKQVTQALADLAQDLGKAKEAVTTATTPEAVQAAEDKGVDAITEDVLEAAQLDALNKLAKDEKATIAAIESNPNLTPEEKAAALAKADELATEAKVTILAADTKEAVQAVEETADKDLAKVEVKAAADDAKKAIDANVNLTDAEKATAKAAVDAAVTAANTAIDGATSPSAIEAATLTAEKAAAKEEVKAAADDAKKAIDSNPNLSDAEKATAKTAVDSELAKATAAVDASVTADAVDAATVLGEQEFAKDVLDAA
ncbi:TPA: DUF1542 domain-containing protein, partial [Streptococcus suis]